MTPRTLRSTSRWIHIAAGALLNTYVYITWFHPGSLQWLAALLGIVVIPLTVVTGVAMWKQPLAMRLLRRTSATTPNVRADV